MICLVGGNGKIAKRYKAIFETHQIAYQVYDVDTPEIDLFSFEKYIICTPTDTHVSFLKKLVGKTILCEKPISKLPDSIPSSLTVYCVNNYQYVAKLMNQHAPYQLTYDYFQTGPDGFYWDLSQIIYMDPHALLHNKSPTWDVTINDQIVPYRIIEQSYIEMIVDFHQGRYENLWTLEQGKQMSKAVLQRMKIDRSICQIHY